MTQQKHGGKPNFKSFKDANGSKKKKAKPSSGYKPKRTPAHENHFLLTARGFCEEKCGACVSCIIAKGDEENRQRIEGRYQPYRSRYGW